MSARDASLRWLPVLVPAIIAGYYATGVAAGPHLFDAGELAAAAWDLSGSHPPGQPVHALLGHAAALIPLGPIPARIALLSVVCLLLAALAAGRATRILCSHLELATLAPVAATASATCVMLAPPLLRQATRVEVYALALALFAWSSLELLCWARAGGRGALLRGALAAGLCASVHAPHALAAILLGAMLALWLRRDLFHNPRVIAAAAGFALLALIATSAYLPVRAAAGTSMWGDPTSPDGLLAYLTGRTFQHNLQTGHEGYLHSLWVYARHAIVGVGIVPALGTLWLAGRPGTTGRFGQALVAAVTLSIGTAAIQPMQVFIPDHVAYLGPAILLMSIGGIVGLTHAIANSARAGRALARLGLGLAALNPLALPDIGSHARADLPALETLASSLVETPPPRAIAITTTDYAGASWMMARSIDGARPDVALFLSGFASSSWQWRQLARHPALDGKPVRGVGRDASSAYLNGLLGSTVGRIPVLLESDLVPAAGAPIAGPYVLLDQAPASDADVRLDSSIGERLVDAIAADRRRGPAGDHGSGDAIIRHYELVRARRLLQRGATTEGMRGLLRASHTPQSLLSGMDLGARPRRTPPVVRRPTGFMESTGDARRELAVRLWSLGQLAAAKRVLKSQAASHDWRALLQLAWLRAAEGDLEGARNARDQFLRAAPHLAGESQALDAHLRDTRAEK